MHSFLYTFYLEVWYIFYFCISICDFYNGCNFYNDPNFYSFYNNEFKTYTKRICMIGIFIHYLVNTSIILLRIIFRIFYFVMFIWLFSLLILLLLCIFVNILRVSYLFFTSFNDCNSTSSSAFVHFHANININIDCFKSNNDASANDLCLLFPGIFKLERLLQ